MENGAETGLDIYQAYLGEAQMQALPACAIPYNVAGNTANDQREYELFRKIAAERPAGAGPWGLVSAKFELKTMVPLEDFQRFATARLADGFECVFINPMIGNEAIHLNVWEQWWVANESVIDLAAFLETVGPINSNGLMGSDCFSFCNYFVGSSVFWRRYFAYVEKFSEALAQQFQQQTAVGRFYGSSGVYARDASVTTRPFIIERLFSSFLATNPDIRRSAYPMTQAVYIAKFGSRLGEALFHLNALKNLALQSSDQPTFDRWQALRAELFPAAMNVIWQLDDPPEIMVSREFRPSLMEPAPSSGAGLPA